ncbi:MAG TPA: hypothetical protein VK021_04030, partial [Flavobacteriaceae bacterium]|nr:hypothetical protein [Flavobacteriaceae bacterium]
GLIAKEKSEINHPPYRPPYFKIRGRGRSVFEVKNHLLIISELAVYLMVFTIYPFGSDKK